MPSLDTITSFHDLRQNVAWPTDLDDQRAAFARAMDYQRAFYPVRDPLTETEQLIFDDAIALLSLEMVNAPAMRAAQVVKKLKEQSSSGAAIETEYEASPVDPFPQITAMLAPLAPAPQRAAVHFSRMSR